MNNIERNDELIRTNNNQKEIRKCVMVDSYLEKKSMGGDDAVIFPASTARVFAVKVHCPPWNVALLPALSPGLRELALRPAGWPLPAPPMLVRLKNDQGSVPIPRELLNWLR